MLSIGEPSRFGRLLTPSKKAIGLQSASLYLFAILDVQKKRVAEVTPKNSASS